MTTPPSSTDQSRGQLEVIDALDRLAIDVARMLAADSVEHFGKGHPGTAMALAPAAYVMYQKVMRHDPADPAWEGRDRFVLSCGHASLVQYAQLMLAGYDLSLKDLQSYRQHDSRTPSHPELHLTPGVEVTTGPLGQGVSMAVGMAMDAVRQHAMFDPETPFQDSTFGHDVFVICSDGDIQEGASAEAASIAGNLELGNLVVVYDDNRILSDGPSDLSMREDVAARYRAYGWHVQEVELAANGNVAVDDLLRAITTAREIRDRPSFISMRSTIAWPAPRAQNTPASHGAPLGAKEVALTKTTLGFDPDVNFYLPDAVLARTREAVDRGRDWHDNWNVRRELWRMMHPDRAKVIDRIDSGRFPDGVARDLPISPAGTEVVLRSALAQYLSVMHQYLPEFWGGSADLGGSNGTTVDRTTVFLPSDHPNPLHSPTSITVHWGVRELAMAACLNGIALGGRARPFGATFLVFSDYMRGAMRLAALMQLPVVYIFTHDSIGLGEDGATHQPVEQLAGLRAIPGLDVVRPADANELAAALLVLESRHRPVAFALARLEVTSLPLRGETLREHAATISRGAYVVRGSESQSPDVILIASGSEVGIAMRAADLIEANTARSVRVVSMVCEEWFLEQDDEYRDHVLPPTVRARVAIEAAAGQPWYRWVGLDGEVISVERFGSSSSGAVLYELMGVTAEHVSEAVDRLLERLVTVAS